MANKKQLLYAMMPHILKAVIAIGVAVMIVSIFSERITKIGLTLSEKRVMTLALQKRSETVATLRDTFAAIGNSDQRIRDAFLTTDNVLEFVTAVETIGNQNSMQQSLKFGVPEPPLVETSTIIIIPVSYTITANGTITTLSNYMHQFEALSYFAGIRSITISTGSPKGWEDTSTITIQGTLYTKKSL